MDHGGHSQINRVRLPESFSAGGVLNAENKGLHLIRGFETAKSQGNIFIGLPSDSGRWVFQRSPTDIDCGLH